MSLHRILIIVLCFFIAGSAGAQKTDPRLLIADPTVFVDSGTYYLYGTSSSAHPQGFVAYTSKDLVNWSGPAGRKDGYVLIKGDAYGTAKFWAPQIFRYQNKYYMAYTANEHIAIASADSPLGPFTQAKMGSLIPDQKQIDPFVFIDTNGKVYLYHVIVANGGNRINVVELNEDLTEVIAGTLQECITVTDSWENTENDEWTVTEGPTVVKEGKLYYMIYSANHFRSKDYAVGYAVSSSPMGPWKKYKGNPIISRRNIGVPGVGHGDFFTDNAGNLKYILHAHQSENNVAPRATGILDLKFDGKKEKTISVSPETFRFLRIEK